MSHHKFAAITGSLLARKGEAGPSAAPRRDAPEPWRALPPRVMEEAPAARAENAPMPFARTVPQAAPALGEGALRKVALRLTEEQHRRMRVVAAQLQMTHQALLAAALESHLANLCDGRLSACSCLGKDKSCGGCD